MFLITYKDRLQETKIYLESLKQELEEQRTTILFTYPIEEEISEEEPETVEEDEEDIEEVVPEIDFDTTINQIEAALNKLEESLLYKEEKDKYYL